MAIINQQEAPPGGNPGKVFGTDININSPGGVTAPFPTAPEPVSDTTGIRRSVQDMNSKIGGVDMSLPPLPTAPVFGEYNSAQERQVIGAGQGVASQYDALIAQAQEAKRQGMAKETVAAGERGGFLNSQFAGIAATKPIVGGDFAGVGGQLERIKSGYDLNIQNLQSQKISAVESAKQAMRQYIDSGRQQDFENARVAYQDALNARDAQMKAQADAQKALADAQKANFDLTVPISESGEEVQQYALDMLKKYPGVIDAYINAGGDPADLGQLTANQLAYLVSKDPAFQKEQQGKLDTEVISVGGRKVLINSQTGETIRNLGVSGEGGEGGGGLGGGTVAVTGGGVTPGAQQALNVILGSGKFTKDQAKAVKNAIESGEDPLIVIKNQAKNIMPNSVATDLTNLEVAKASLDSLSSSLQKFYAAGGDTGIFKGNLEKTINKLGEVKDPKLVSLAVQISTAIQKYRHAVSGTAFSVQEGQQIDSVFPGINKSQGLNNAIISGRLDSMTSDIDSGYRSVLGSSYDALKGGGQESGPSDEDIAYTLRQNASNYPTREALRDALVAQGIPADRINSMLYSVLPDKR